MNTKPSDFMLNVIEFFGILIPGAVFFFLHGNWTLLQIGIQTEHLDTTKYWIIAFFASLILGHLLLGASEIFDKPVSKLAKSNAIWCMYLKSAIEKNLNLPEGIKDTPSNYFFTVFSFLRVNNVVAVAELERLAADKKLFRSLTLLFIIDIPLYVLILKSTTESPIDIFRIISSLVIMCLAALRFIKLHRFTYTVAFDLYLHVRNRVDNS